MLVAAAVTGCTALLGSFDVGPGDGTPNLPDGQTTGDGPGVGDGSGLDGSTDTTVPVVCNAPEVACNNTCTILATSGDHCGKCGHSCGGGGCSAGVCRPVQLFTSMTLKVGAIAVNDADLFFATDDMKLSSCPKSGCKLAPKQLAAMSYSINMVSAVQKAVVFASAPAQTTERPNLYSCPTTGCPSPPPSFASDGLGSFSGGIGVFADKVYFNSQNIGLEWATCQGGVCGVPLTGTPPVTATVTRLGTLTKGTHAFVGAANRMYFVDTVARGSVLASCDLSDTACTPTPLVAGDNADVEYTAIENGRLYWLKPGRLDFNEGKLLSCDLPTCAAPKVGAVGLDSPIELIIDPSGAYWLTNKAKLQRCAPGGCAGGPTDFAGPLDAPHSIVADDAFVYWAEKTSVWRLAK